jgi:hypothetical protein
MVATEPDALDEGVFCEFHAGKASHGETRGTENGERRAESVREEQMLLPIVPGRH